MNVAVLFTLRCAHTTPQYSTAQHSALIGSIYSSSPMTARCVGWVVLASSSY
jgi:hypothetical protein